MKLVVAALLLCGHNRRRSRFCPSSLSLSGFFPSQSEAAPHGVSSRPGRPSLQFSYGSLLRILNRCCRRLLRSSALFVDKMALANTEIVYEGWLVKSPPTKRIWRAVSFFIYINFLPFQNLCQTSMKLSPSWVSLSCRACV